MRAYPSHGTGRLPSAGAPACSFPPGHCRNHRLHCRAPLRPSASVEDRENETTPARTALQRAGGYGRRIPPHCSRQTVRTIARFGLRLDRQTHVGGARRGYLRTAHAPCPSAVRLPVQQTMQYQPRRPLAAVPFRKAAPPPGSRTCHPYYQPHCGRSREPPSHFHRRSTLRSSFMFSCRGPRRRARYQPLGRVSVRLERSKRKHPGSYPHCQRCHHPYCHYPMSRAPEHRLLGDPPPPRSRHQTLFVSFRFRNTGAAVTLACLIRRALTPLPLLVVLAGIHNRPAGSDLKPEG